MNQTVAESYRITNILANMSEQELSRFEGAKLSDLQRALPRRTCRHCIPNGRAGNGHGSAGHSFKKTSI